MCKRENYIGIHIVYRYTYIVWKPSGEAVVQTQPAAVERANRLHHERKPGSASAVCAGTMCVWGQMHCQCLALATSNGTSNRTLLFSTSCAKITSRWFRSVQTRGGEGMGCFLTAANFVIGTVKSTRTPRSYSRDETSLYLLEVSQKEPHFEIKKCSCGANWYHPQPLE